MMPATQKHYDMSAYDQAIDLVRDQITALKGTQDKLEACQAEKDKLYEALKYYARTEWKTISLVDRGEQARKILQETNGKGAA